jgi:gamma-glutamylcyclotransferase (GGCT)/AIG2-like uncharacterized protein YtfP
MGTKIHTVAVYGTLMADERNEHWAADALERKPCVLRGTLYDTGWGFPAFVPDDDGGEVQAELLTVTQATLSRMDRLEGCPSLYRRERVTAALSGGGVAEAWVYVMNRMPRDARVIGSGDWKSR